MSMWWCLRLRREVASVPLARQLLLGAMETAGVEREVAYELSVALSEACANAVEHGVGARSDEFCVTSHLDGDVCRIEVTDCGPGFPPAVRHGVIAPERATDCEAETGRGLLMIEHLTDSVHVGNRPGRGGAVISFTKRLKWQDGSARFGGFAEEPALMKVG